MAAVEIPPECDTGQEIEPGEVIPHNTYHLGANDDYEDEQEEIVPGCYYAVDTDFPSPPYENEDGEIRGPLTFVNDEFNANSSDFVLQKDDNYDDRVKLTLNNCNTFLDNEEPMTLNVLPLFQHAESADVVYEEPLKPAKLVGKYLIGADLGEGSYGKVKDALDTESLVRRAVKILRQRRLRKIPNGEQNVLREIALHRELQHPNVVKLADILRVSSTSSPNGTDKILATVASSPATLLDTNSVNTKPENPGTLGVFGYVSKGGSFATSSSLDDKLYVVMEYCVTALQQVLDSSPNRRLPEWQAHSYFQQLLEGLQYLHSKGIIHKDIKPGNLLIGNDGDIKICDFGVAEKLSPFAPNDLVEGSQGSPIVQPPEVANGESPFHGFKLDVWSAGVTLYCMLAGCFPFEGENIYQVFHSITKGVFDMPTEFDAGVQQLIGGMLAYSVEERFSLDEVCMHDWVRRRHPCTGAGVSLSQWNKPPTVLTALEKHGCPSFDFFLPNGNQSVPNSPHLGSPATLTISFPVPASDEAQADQTAAASSPQQQTNNGRMPTATNTGAASVPTSPSHQRSFRRSSRRNPGTSTRKFFRRIADHSCSLS